MTHTIESLLDDLESYGTETGKKAIEEFGKLREDEVPRAAELLVRKLLKSNEGIQYAARDALGNLSESAIPVLLSFIEGTHYDDSRSYAKTALSKIKSRYINNNAQEQDAVIIGQWVVLGSSVEFKISFLNGVFQVEGLDTDDNEEINIREPKWDGQTLELTSIMPSGWTIHSSMRLSNSNTMIGTYHGNASGQETWKRKGQLFTPDN